MATVGSRASAPTPCAPDVTDEADVVAMVAAVLERHGQLDILVNLAGIYPVASIENETLAGWKRLIEVNLDSTFLCCKHALAPDAQTPLTDGSSTSPRVRSTTARRGSPRMWPPRPACSA